MIRTKGLTEYILESELRDSIRQGNGLIRTAGIHVSDEVSFDQYLELLERKLRELRARKGVVMRIRLTIQTDKIVNYRD